MRHLKSGRVTFVDGLSELFTYTDKLRTAKSVGESGQRFVRDPKLDVVERTVLDAVEHSKHENLSLLRKRTLLVLDGLDLYIAATGWPLQEVNDMLEEWREVRSATLDSPSIVVEIQMVSCCALILHPSLSKSMPQSYLPPQTLL